MTYETTHPWIRFKLDLSNAPSDFWMRLGEAVSKCEHLAGSLLKPSTAKNLHMIYLARGALASTAIEGNNLSEKEALQVVQGTSKLPRSQAYMAQEISNIVAAINSIMNDAESGANKSVSPSLIKEYNAFALNKLDHEEHVVPGKYREVGMEISTYVAPDHEDIPGLVDDLCAWLNGDAFKNISGNITVRNIIRAIIAHIYIAWIHPFGDGNGRTARLLEFRYLIEGGVPSPAAHLLSNHYNKTRSEYYRRLEEISKNGGDITPFLAYALGGFVDQLREQIEEIRQQLWDIAWQNYVHEKLGSKKSPSSLRRLQLTLALAVRNEGYRKSEIPNISPEIARLYATKTDKTLTRDLNELKKLFLIKAINEKYVANTEILSGFLPRSKALNRSE